MANVLRQIREQAQTLHISRDSDTWAIYSSDNVMLGVMNQRTASNLASLPSGDQLAYEAFMETSKLDETIDSYLRGNRKVQFDVTVNVIGPGSISDAVGQQLSERRLFLQRPYQLPEGIEYSNPQYLAIDDQIDDGLEDYDCEGGGVSNTDPLDGDQLPVQDDLDGQLWSIFDSSSLPEEMVRIEINQSIHTTLMEYVLYPCETIRGWVSERVS